MSVAHRIVSQPLQQAGFNHMQNAIGFQLDSNHAGGVLISGGSYAQTQKLVIRNMSWAETNLQMTVASAAAPSEDEVAAAKAAIARIAARQNENVDEWAAMLGNKLGAIID